MYKLMTRTVSYGVWYPESEYDQAHLLLAKFENGEFMLHSTTGPTLREDKHMQCELTYIVFFRNINYV